VALLPANPDLANPLAAFFVANPSIAAFLAATLVRPVTPISAIPVRPVALLPANPDVAVPLATLLPANPAVPVSPALFSLPQFYTTIVKGL